MPAAEPHSRFLAACRLERADATPAWFMRQAGRYLPEYRRIRARASILEICERPELAAEVTLQPVRRLDVDAAILFADILLPARPMGLRLRYLEGEGPSIDPPVRDERAVERLREFDPAEELGSVLQAVRLVRRELDPGVALIGFAGAPFTLAAYLVEGGPSKDYRWTKRLMRSDPSAWRRLMGKLARVTAAYLRAQAAAGAQALQLFDSWAGALAPEDYRRYAAPYSRQVLQSLEAAGVPVIHFGTGTAGFLEEFAGAGGDVIGVDWRVPLDRAWPRLGRCGIQGNLDPAVLATAPRRELKREVRRILREAGGRPGHVFNLGHGVLPSTPVGSVQAVADWVHELSSR